MKRENRCRVARENAGLSVGQAAKLLAVDRDEILRVEVADDPDLELVQRLADLYRVRVEWLTGEVERRDYARIKRIKGADRLSFKDLDTLAEFAASMPRRKP